MIAGERLLGSDQWETDMLKFMVVIYRRPDLTHEQFRRNLQEVHGP
jgi:hypothetical protein